MPIKVEQFEGEPIIIATVTRHFVPESDVPVMFAQFIPMRREMPGQVTLIVDMQEVINDPGAFSQMMFTLAEASRGIKTSQTVGLSGPPRLIMVGDGPVAALASEAIAQDQYGGVKGQLCATLEDALALARQKE